MKRVNNYELPSQNKRMKTTVADEPCYNADGEVNSCCSYKDLRQYIEECFQRFEQNTLAKYTVILASLAEQTIMLEQFCEPQSLASYFPITSEEHLQNVDAIIKEGARSKCLATVKAILKGGLIKNIEGVLSREVCLSFNLDGCHGKKRFKDFEFYGVLREAVAEKYGDAESELRKAFQAVKKRFFKQKSMQLNSAHRKEELERNAQATTTKAEESESNSNT